MLGSSDVALDAAYDLAVLDLDGVVYVGDHAVAGASEALARAATSMKLAFVTNNAARTPDHVAAHLTELGVRAGAGDVVTSAQAGARLLAEMLPGRSRVFVLGTTGIFEALREEGLEPVTSSADDPVAVIQGYGPDMPWSRVVEGTILVGRGLPWVATNVDSTIPTSHGIGPGNGALVGLVARHTGRTPIVAGKPDRPLLEETQRRVGGERPLMIGDRLDTDISGAIAMGWSSLLVLTGVSGLNDLANAAADQRPTYIGVSLGALLEAHRAPQRVGDEWHLAGWSASTVKGRLSLEGAGDPEDWWRCAASAMWAHLDATGQPADVSGVVGPR